jgi:hypothetical protein
MKYYHIDPTFLLEGYNLFEANTYEQLVDKLVSIQGLINAGVEGEVNAAKNMYGKVLDRIRKEFGDLKAKQAEDAVARRSYKKPEPKQSYQEPPRSTQSSSQNNRSNQKDTIDHKYKKGDRIVFISYTTKEKTGIINKLNSKLWYIVYAEDGSRSFPIHQSDILGKTRFKIGDTVLVGKVKSVVENFIQDNVYGFKIVLRDALKPFRDEDLTPFVDKPKSNPYDEPDFEEFKYKDYEDFDYEEPKSNPYDDEKEYSKYKNKSSGKTQNGEYYDPTSGWTFKIARFTDPYAGKRGSDKLIGYAYKNGMWKDFYGGFGGKQSNDPSTEFAAKKRFTDKCSKKKDPYVPVNIEKDLSSYKWLFQQAIYW